MARTRRKTTAGFPAVTMAALTLAEFSGGPQVRWAPGPVTKVMDANGSRKVMGSQVAGDPGGGGTPEG